MNDEPRAQNRKSQGKHEHVEESHMTAGSRKRKSGEVAKLEVGAESGGPCAQSWKSRHWVEQGREPRAVAGQAKREKRRAEEGKKRAEEVE